MSRIFISYSRADRQFVDEIVPLLRRMYGHDSVWFDDDIHGGVDWWAMILREVARCDLFIYLASNDSLESPYCQAEFREALRLQKQFLPVIVRPKTAYPGDVAPDLELPLRQTQYVDLSHGFGDTNALTLLYASVNRLLDAVPPQQPPPLDPQPVRQPPVPDKPAGRRFRLNEPWAMVIAAVLTGVFVIIAAFIGLSGNDDGGEDTAPTRTEQAVGMVDSPAPTATPEPLTPTPEPPTASPTVPTDTPEPPTATQTPTPTATYTPTLSATELEQTIAAEMALALTDEVQTAQAIQTQTVLAVTDVAGTADAYQQATAAALTATATQWTATPTPDVRATAHARLTATQNAAIALATDSAIATATQAARDQTATATLWTFTPTPSDTPTLTPTPSYTPTLTPTVPTNTPKPPTATPDPLQVALEIARDFSGDNNDWGPFEWDFDGVTMVLVPAGCFMMGSEDGGSDESPVHRVCFDEPFWIDKYEVTNAQFAAFDGQANRDSYWDDPNRPREQITWYEARDFCEARDARLPSEAEWEYAARGPDALVYPWGDRFEGDNVVYGENSGGQTAAVGSKPNGASWVGALDMSGNVWEWVADWYDDDYYGTLDDGAVNPTGPGSGEYRVLRGGSWWDGYSGSLRGADRSGSGPDLTPANYGFRCARSN